MLGIGVHTKAARTNDASTLTTPGVATNIGSGLIVGMTWQGGVFTRLYDNYGNGEPLQIDLEFGSTQLYRFYYWPLLRKAGAGHTVTLDVNATSYMTLVVLEVVTTNLQGIYLDQHNGGLDSASPFMDALSITTLVRNALIVQAAFTTSFSSSTDPDTYTPGGNWVMDENQTTISTMIPGVIGHLPLADSVALGTFTGNWTALRDTAQTGFIGSFGEAPPMSPPSLFPLLVAA